MFSSPVQIAGPLPPANVRQSILDAVEALRLADQLLGRMRNEVDSPYADECDDWLRANQAECRMFAAILQEQAGGVLPTISSALATLSSYENRWPHSHPFAEATALTGLLAARHLGNAIEKLQASGKDHEALVDVLHAAAERADRFACIADDLSGLVFISGGGWIEGGADAILDKIIGGAELPAKFTQADVKKRYKAWAHFKGEGHDLPGE